RQLFYPFIHASFEALCGGLHLGLRISCLNIFAKSAHGSLCGPTVSACLNVHPERLRRSIRHLSARVCRQGVRKDTELPSRITSIASHGAYGRASRVTFYNQQD